MNEKLNIKKNLSGKKEKLSEINHENLHENYEAEKSVSEKGRKLESELGLNKLWINRVAARAATNGLIIMGRSNLEITIMTIKIYFSNSDFVVAFIFLVPLFFLSTI